MNMELSANDTVWTIGRLLSWTTEHLASREVDEPRLCAEVLLAHAAGCRRIDVYARFEEVPQPPIVDRFRAMVRRAAKHEPVAYLVGNKEFFSLSFAVGPGVLIPRPETETLVETIIDYCGATDLQAPRLLDMGTGCGCIAIAALKQLPEACACGTDNAPEALVFAQTNAERHEVTDRLTLLRADRLALPADVVPKGGFDVIASNPPYVARDEVKTLSANVRDYEPAGALSDNGDGLGFYRSLASDGVKLLKAGGAVFVEVGAGQAPAVLDVFADTAFTHQGTRRDRVGGHDRVLWFVVGENM